MAAESLPTVKQATRGTFNGGYTSAVPAFMAGENQLVGAQDASDTNSSRDCFIDPISGGVYKRPGLTIVNDTIVSGATKTEDTGLLNKKWSARSRKFFALDTPSMSNGYPIPAVLFGSDGNSGFPTVDNGFPGTIWASSTNSGASTDALKNYSLGEEFLMGDTYGVPATEQNASDYRFRMVPIHIDSGDGVYNRCALTGTAGTDKFMQQFMTCGSRALVQTQSWLHAPNLRCTPWRWNKEMNESSTVGTRTFRLYPTGPFGPLFPPTATTPTADTTVTNWEDGDTYYVSVMYQFEDGSYSLPFIPRAPQATGLTAGLGLVTVGTIGESNKYRSITYTKIAIGPKGTIARVLLRTPKQNRSASDEKLTLEPLDLRIIGVLRNNTQTSYVDFAGDDDTLVEDADAVRIDLVCPRRARYIGTGDQRVAISYTLPNTSAIMLALVGAATSFDKNVDDDDALNYGASAFLVRITSSQLELHYNGGAGPNFAGGGNAVAFAFATYDTLDKLVDIINTTTVDDANGATTIDNAKQWRAQLAPGIDGSMPSTSLTLTTFDIAVTGTSSVTLTGAAADVAKVGIGMKVSGTNITAGTYVVAKPSATTITISTATTGAPGATSTFYQETGDNGIVTGGTLGYMRSFGPNLPLLLCCKPSAFPNYDKPDKVGVYFTMSSPGALTSGVSLAPNSFLSGNKLLPHSSPRQQMQRACTGIVDLEGAGLIAYNDGIYLWKNNRGGNSGEDFDCRLYTINDGRGCIAYGGLVSGNGWAAYPTTEGIMVTDKEGREFTISGDIFNASEGKGDLAYEIKTSAASVAADTDDQFLHCSVLGSKLAVAFRNGIISDPRILYYDFSPGVEASGVAELLNPETKSAYIWNPPAIYNSGLACGSPGAMGSIRNASGRVDHICFDGNFGATGDGRVDAIGTGITDNTFGYTAYGTAAPVVASPFMALLPKRIEATHLTAGTAAKVFLANNQTPTFSTPLARDLNVDANRTQYQKQPMNIDQGQRGKTDMFWMQWRSPTGSSTTDRFWRLVLEYEEAEIDVVMTDLV